MRFDRRTAAPKFDPVRLPGGEDWLLAPVVAGMVKYESLLDGTVGLIDIARCNDALAARSENEARAIEAARNSK